MSGPGRNDPCPCGSGRKYKQCCLARAGVPARGADPAVAGLLQWAADLNAANRGAEAEQACLQVLRTAGEIPEARRMLGLIAFGKGDLGAALDHYRKSLSLQSDDAQSWYMLGQIHNRSGQWLEAIECLKRAIRINKKFPAAYNTMGLALDELGRDSEAYDCYRKSVALDPEFYPAVCNLGNADLLRGRVDEAVASLERAVARRPEIGFGHVNLGDGYLRQGDLARAIVHLRRAIVLAPDLVAARDYLLLALNYVTTAPEDLLQAHRDYDQLIGRSTPSATSPHDNERTPERRLRIGYLSPDFRRHSVATFIEPVLAAHDKTVVELFGYYNCPIADDVTERIRAGMDHWQPCHGLSDAQLADRIRADAIDILVDLSGHTSGNRLPVFARRPAPIQISYLGYPATTGLAAMDYRLVTADTDPPGAEAWHSERLYRLPRTLWVYRPDPQMPAVDPGAPARRHGHIRFLSANNVAKLSDATLATWVRLLAAVPGSMLTVTNISDGVAQRLLRKRFTAHGGEPARLEILGKLPGNGYFDLLSDVDIALDPWPYNGTTTSCDCLWMGLPLITLVGRTSAGRSGYAILKAIGLEALAARNEDDYIKLAAGLALDLPRLESLRGSMRERIAASVLRDDRGLAGDIEAAFRAMWRDWCNNGRSHESEGRMPHLTPNPGMR